MEDRATEVLVRDGHIQNGIAALDLLVVDMRGEVHEGWLLPGQNPVCITFDIFLQALPMISTTFEGQMLRDCPA